MIDFNSHSSLLISLLFPFRLGRKRPLFFGHENEPPLYTKKCLAGLKTLLDRYQSDSRATQHARLQ